MMRMMNELTLDELFQLCKKRLETIFSYYLENIPSVELKNAMEYTIHNGGKRLRPLLIYATGLLFNAPLESLDIPASAVELIHTYSLIHDDLPCMDNSELRRGKPTCHKKYGDGIAVLTGDALHTLAMQILSNHPAPLSDKKRVQMMKTLSTACGPYGMAAGQALDITILNETILSEDLITKIYHLKTGALFSACIELGYLASPDENEKNKCALKEFGNYVGLGFQIQDDILDMEASTELLGKPQGLDGKNNKLTYPKLHGIHHAKQKVHDLYQNALETINLLAGGGQLLRELTGYMLQRNA